MKQSDKPESKRVRYCSSENIFIFGARGTELGEKGRKGGTEEEVDKPLGETEDRVEGESHLSEGEKEMEMRKEEGLEQEVALRQISFVA
jgi:hypothetical protein